jgi:ribosomal protein S18 acetylase RimI-like enzyme
MPHTIRIMHVEQDADLAAIRALFAEYQTSLGDFDSETARIDAEVAGLPGEYAPPRGRLLLALVGASAAGCIALRPHADDACEMKRLYVRPDFRGQGLARRLCDMLIAEARAAGYARMLLDTLPSMGSAQGLYADLGFRDISAYLPDRAPDTRFMELVLGDRRRPTRAGAP